jgi:L-ascorbate metabolism protein UlaG (beta-lactamase superfamily)/glycosyltransferase involved in cell wall biosynthesis
MAGQVIYVDPYLSHSVQALDAPDLVRLVPIQLMPENVTDANWVLLTHEHIDHCDPHTVPKLAAASPACHFVGPVPVIEKLTQWGIAQERLHLAVGQWTVLSPGLELRAVLAAHPHLEQCADGSWRYVGFLLRNPKGTLYLAGDTRLCDELIAELQTVGPIHTAFLPVNEINYFRNRRGIIGNMSVREAFGLAQELGIEQVVAVHWDMFAINEVYPEEIRLLHHKMGCSFKLLMSPHSLNLGRPKASVVVRTLNEARYLPELLEGIAVQVTNGIDFEVVLVDSGSTDATLAIAERYGCRILHIHRDDFSFGRSLNMGCQAAEGDILVITSGHCVPVDPNWLQALCQPLLDGHAQYSYGRQVGGPDSHYSERRVFEKYFGAQSRIPQDGFYCNNANSALLKAVWQRHRFDEDLTGLEDMALAQQLVRQGGKLAYVAESIVFHHHSETWSQVKRRFEREAIALQQILPQVHVGLLDTARYILSSIWRDWRHAWQVGVWPQQALNIARYRYYQFTGSSAGNHEHRKLSHAEKEKYFYPH